MKAFDPTPELLAVARHVLWFEPPEETLADPVRFLTYAMNYGTHSDLVQLHKAGIGLEHYREALAHAPPGIFDKRSWTYWNLKCGHHRVPPLPVRSFGLD
jgi:hypothetical protein